jgi:hypothetical protein
MSNSQYQVTHMPEVAAGVVEVNGESVVETGLRNVASVVLTYNETNFVPNEEGLLSWYHLTPNSSKIVIRTEKTGTGSGTLGDTPMSVSFIAIGN